MQYKLPLILALSMMTAGAATAQTVSTFEDLTLPGADTSFLEVIAPVDGIYPFTTGNTKFYGKLGYGGGYQAQFNYSNRTDTVNPGYENMWAAITGEGAENSANYGITYAETDFSNFFQSPENGPKLLGDAAGSKVAGLYITNTTVAYRWIQDNYTSGDFFKVTIRGYLNNVRTADSVVFTLASYGTDTTLINTWEWVNLLPLGNVDSITFQTSSSDDFTPYYFAIDNLTTLDGVCPVADNIAATSVNENSATINWSSSVSGFETTYEVAVDQSATLTPTATPVTATTPTYAATSLSAATTYYVHVRAACEDGGLSAWDTASFTTLGNVGILQTQANTLQLNISPNPVSNQLNLHTAATVNAQVYSIDGKEMMSVKQAKTINVAQLAAGVYLLQVTEPATGQQATLRFTKH